MAPAEQHAVPDASAAVRACKQDARKSIKAALQQMSEADMRAESTSIAKHVLEAPFFRDSRSLGIYVHCARLREVDTSSVLDTALASGKSCYVPVVEDKQANMRFLHLDALSSLVSVPPFGILEPPPSYANGARRPDAIQDGLPMDVLLLPGLGFDTSGNRLGRGGGYYDKALDRLTQKAQEKGRQPPLLVGLAYSCQVSPQIPTAQHDKQLDALVTASKVHTFSDRAAAACGVGQHS